LFRIWWVFLATGVLLLILGSATLVKSPESTVALAQIAGITFVLDGLLLCLLAWRAEEWSGFYLLGALTGVAGIVLLLFLKGHEPVRLADILVAALTLRGLIDALVAWGGISDFTESSRALWDWILLAVGSVIFLLGLLALVTRGGSNSVLVLIVGCQALARGIGMLAVASRLRVLAGSED
jgi:uncharacterized membrane protein HdeD (DUF308 family)